MRGVSRQKLDAERRKEKISYEEELDDIFLGAEIQMALFEKQQNARRQ